MARSRNIKPAFFLNEDLADTDPLARLLFIGLWTLADYKGHLEWKPRKIKAQILPYEDCDIDALGNALDKSGVVRYYSVQGKRYLEVVNFARHQHPHINEKKAGSLIPTPEDADAQVIDNNGLNQQDGTRTEQGRNKDGTNPADSLLLIPDSLNPLKKTKAKKLSDGLDFSTWPQPLADMDLINDFLAAKKKAKGSLTQRAINTVGKQLHLAMQQGFTVEQCLERAEDAGWKSFRAEYMGNGTHKQNNRSGGAVSTFDWAAEQAEQATGSTEPQQDHGAIGTDGSPLQLPDASEFEGWQR